MPEQNLDQNRKLAFLAHDIRTSLTATKWILDMLIKGDVGPVNNEQRAFLEKAYESNESLINKTNQILSNKNISAKEDKISDIVKTIQEILFYFHALSNSKKVELIFLKTFETLEVQISPEDLRIVIQNLLDNAIKYSNTGDKVIISLDEQDGKAILRIRDNGIGIEQDECTKIFEENFRAQNAIAHTKDGAGLGLFAVKTILEKWGGEITCESKINEGSVFQVSIPSK